MQLLKNEKVIDIMEKTLNHVDARLTDHGKRVAYLIYKILKPQRKFSDQQLRDICMLAMLHDVGAYKTEEIDKMVIFETIDVWDHSIYGYLFLKYFSPLKELAPVLLFHHAECEEIMHLEDPEHTILAQLISLCDRADVFTLHGGDHDDFIKYINKNRNIKYRDDIADLFLTSDINIDTVFDDIDADKSFNNVFRKTPLTTDEVNGYVNMIIYSIDFRSSQTVVHTIAATCIAEFLAKRLGADEEEIKKVRTGAMLHDIGKVGIPTYILESADGLSDSEMDIMKTHVDIAEKILEGNVDDDIKHIAVYHHEKLDGSGYPKQLGIHDIGFFARIVSVADIFSALCGVRSYKGEYPKEEVIEILGDMSAQNFIDPDIVSVAVENFDEIIESVKMEAEPVIDVYNAINEEYLQFRSEMQNKIAIS